MATLIEQGLAARAWCTRRPCFAPLLRSACRRGSCCGRPGAEVVLSERYAGHYDQAPQILRRAARHFGRVRRDDLDSPLLADPLDLALQQPGTLTAGEWAWLVPDRSQVGKLIRRLLTAVGAVPVEVVLEALKRATRHHPANTGRVPADVLIAHLQSQDAFELRDGTVAPMRRTPHLLTDTDRVLLAAFARSEVRELPTSELAAALLSSDRSSQTAQTVIGLSPLLRQRGHGVQALRGEASPFGHLASVNGKTHASGG